MMHYNVILLFMFLILNSSCSKSNKILESIPDSYIVSFKDSSSYKTAKICFDTFTSKIGLELVTLKSLEETNSDENAQIVIVDVQDNLPYDANVFYDEMNIHLQGKSSNVAIWLFNQYLKRLSVEDDRIISENIPPAIISFEDIRNLKFAFEYREPFFQPNLNLENNRVLGTNNLESDWGIWGHNFGKLLNIDPKDSYFSEINGKINKGQICFSSRETYSFLENYISENYGAGTAEYSVNFNLVPNDNQLVCTCSKCKKTGNTSKNATPAVIQFINKIAKKFPKHAFFTVDYLTVQNTVKEKVPNNVGVFVSSIEVPNTFNFEDENLEKKVEFERKIKDWKKYSNKVYVWDYASNFDDYLSPFPNLFLKQKQLQFYKNIGVSGVFLNASGYDYSTFDDVKTYIFSALLINPELDVKELLTQYYEQYYPVTGSKIVSYLLSIEKNFEDSKPALNIYGGINEALKTYLNQKEFVEFYNYLITSKDSLSSQEKRKVDKLITALTFTYMQICLHNGANKNGYLHFNEENTVVLNTEYLRLFDFLDENYSANKIDNFKEFQGDLNGYLNEVKSILLKTNDIKNELLFKKIQIVSKLDENYTNVAQLTDGVKGIPSDYHTNWMFFSAPNLEFNLPQILQKKEFELQMSFLSNPQIKTLPPTKIEIFENEKLIKTNVVDHVSQASERVIIKTFFKVSDSGKIKVRVVGNENYKKIACDEILLK